MCVVQLLVGLVSAYRYEGNKVKDDSAKSDAKILAEAVASPGEKAIENDEVVRILSTRSKLHLQQLYKHFNQIKGSDLLVVTYIWLLTLIIIFIIYVTTCINFLMGQENLVAWSLGCIWLFTPQWCIALFAQTLCVLQQGNKLICFFFCNTINLFGYTCTFIYKLLIFLFNNDKIVFK